MFKKEKKYKCTMKVKRQWQIYKAHAALTGLYIENNNHERAKQAAIDAEIQRCKFWEVVYELYPGLKNNVRLIYKEIENYVRVND